MACQQQPYPQLGLRYDLSDPDKPPFFNPDDRLRSLDVVTDRLDTR